MKRRARRVLSSLTLAMGGWTLGCGFAGGTGADSIAPPDDVGGDAFVATGDGWAAPDDPISVALDGTLRVASGQAGEPAIRLRTTRIALAGVALTGAPASITQVRPKQLVLDRGLVQERRIETRDGLRQQWEVRRPFATDLVVEVNVEGADTLVADLGGVLLASDAAPSAHYGRATWIDRAGVRTAVLAEVQGTTVRMTVPADVVAASQFPAMLDPTISAEVAMDNGLAGPSGSLAQMPAAASSGNGYLAVWRDDRNGRTSDIYGMVVTAAGKPATPSAFPVAASLGVQSRPTAVFVNGSYLVAWEDYKAPTGNSVMRAARISLTGVVTQLGVVASPTSTQTNPHLGARGNQALLVYEEGGTIRGALYDGSAFAASFDIAPTVGAATPVIAADPGGDYLVAFASGSDVRAQRVSPAGALTGPAFDISAAAGTQFEPSMAFAGGNFVVAFSSGGDIYATRISPAGVVLDTRAEGANTVGGIALISAANVQQRPTLVCGTQCLLVWQDRRNSASYFDIYSKLLTPALAAAGAENVLASGGGLRGQFEPVATAAGSEFAALWRDHRDGGAGYVYASRVSATGAALDGTGVLLALGTNRQSGPAVSRNPQRWLVTWGDSRVEGDNLHTQRISQGGASSGPTTATSTAPGQQQQASASWNGTNHIAAWSDARVGGFDIYASRLDPNGVALDAAGIAISTAANDQFLNDVESGANRTLIVWQDRRGANFDIYGAIMNSAGAIVAPEFPISSATGDQLAASVAFDSTNSQFVVVWQDARAGVNERDLYATRVTTTGQVLDPAGVLVSAAPSSQLTPDIAFGNGRFLIVWDDRRAGNANIFGARAVISAGNLLVLDRNGIPYSNDLSAQTSPAVTFTSNGTRAGFVTAWVDDRNLTTGLDLFGNIVDATSGAIRTGGPNGFAISVSAGDEGKPSLSPDDSGAGAVALIAYQRLFAGAGLRVVARRLAYSEI
jgi:hypothetical protein